ncbi:cytochrome c oxidase assembly protein COX20, mitochondrial-like [Eptesicus fuscus]|uniref:cytochrome c oxidase assembly protein COX20, mitochondrial-like n=1 Tax=Eptesicus fuscus TaxID=29078 RepID=UPI002403E1A6|nr:cytochrome c oxidase assembly protein COX20, mitochondrial-like [Eptesicus fuscus]
MKMPNFKEKWETFSNKTMFSSELPEAPCCSYHSKVELEALTYPCCHLLCPCGHLPELGEHGKRKSFKFLEILDVENISCAQDLVLRSSLGSVVAGLGHFLLDSRIKRLCGVGVGGFILVTIRCWFYCRYNYANLRIQKRIAREGIKSKILCESTHLGPKRKQTNGHNSN